MAAGLFLPLFLPVNRGCRNFFEYFSLLLDIPEKKQYACFTS